MKATENKKRWITGVNLIFLGLAVLFLSACGGGGGGGSTPPTGAGPTAGLASGTIEGFGSVIVNGVKFEVEGAEVEFEHGAPVTISGANQTQFLHEGMHVELEGSFDDNGQTGTATRIAINGELQGEIAAGSVATSPTTGVVSFTLLGQRVLAFPGTTLVDDSLPLNGALSNLAAGQFVEVHGLPDGTGTIQATFIEFKAADQASFNLLSGAGELELTGAITALGTGTLSIGSQLVDTAAAAVDGSLSVGTLVEVKGTLSGTTLVATLVHVEDGFGPQDKIDLEGLVRNLTASQFSLNGQLVDYSSATFFGGVQADLANGLRVEAEGPIANGILVARKIKFKDSFRYEGAVTQLNATTLQIAVPAPAGGTLNVLVDTAIMVDGGSLTANNDIKLRARIADGSNLIAIRISDGGSPNGRQIFEGPVAAFNQANDSVELLNNGTGGGLVEVDISTINDITHPSGSDFEIEDAKVSKAAFYQALNVGDRVKARFDGSWDQIEIELED